MPAGRVNLCSSCYWKRLLEKRIQIDCVAFSFPGMALQFRAFGAWLQEEVGANKAAMVVHRYLPFFLEIERQWQCIPDYPELLAHFGTANLRKVLLPMRWMEATALILPNHAAKRLDSDRRRIDAALERFDEGSKERLLLQGYYKTLIERMNVGKISLRSIRLALSPAMALLIKAAELGCIPPEQWALNDYLVRSPGQRAAVSGFVKYLRRERGVKIALPKEDARRRKLRRRKKLEAELLSLMKENGISDEFLSRWLPVALMYFHSLPRTGIGSNWRDAEREDGLIISWNGFDYWIPIPDLPIKRIF